MKDLKKIAESHLNGLRDMDRQPQPEQATGVAQDATGKVVAQDSTGKVVAQDATGKVVAQDAESSHKESEAIMKIL